MPVKLNPTWPVLKTYDAEHLRRIALPLGGIGTGTVSLGGRGDLRDWEIANQPNKGPRSTGNIAMGRFETATFAVWAQPTGRDAVAKILEGPIDSADYEGQSGCAVDKHGMPRFRNCSFAAAYPLGQVLLNDPDFPLDVRLEAFNPLVPPDADASGIPVAVLRYVLINKTNRAVKASVLGSVPNAIGQRLNQEFDRAGSAIRFRKDGRLRGLILSNNRLCKTAEENGQIALVSPTPGAVTYWRDWPAEQSMWSTGWLRLWDDFSDDGKLDPVRGHGRELMQGFMTVGVSVPPRSEKEVTFLLTWHFPNRYSWSPGKAVACCDKGDYIGNYYTTQYRSAWDVARKIAPKLAKLEADTVRFVGAMVNSDLPLAMRDAALSNISVLRTETSLRTPDGRFFGFEGCCETNGCCHGSCTHVWNYEHTTPFLFGPLARTMREVEFAHATEASGFMHFRVYLPLNRSKKYRYAAADGQMGCIMKMYREWQLSGDDKMLKKLWPNVKRALAFAWKKNGWDSDGDGVMEGCQHNTFDVEWYGPNPLMQCWYLGALRAGEEMARTIGDERFAAACRKRFEFGSQWMDKHLFNGEYYEQHIQPRKMDQIIKGLRGGMGGDTPEKPAFQLGSGCLADQLLGQATANVCGLGPLLKPANIRKTLRSIMKYNWRDGVWNHANHARSYVIGDEQALMCGSFPRGGRPEVPFAFTAEAWTGIEYTAAAGMLAEGQRGPALQIIRAIRDRHNGKNRNPFNEAECGYHYARSMASYGTLIAYTGFHYSAVEKAMTFAAANRAKPTQWFWASGDAYGTVTQKRSGTTGRKIAVDLKVLSGSVALKTLKLKGHGCAPLPRPRILKAGQSLRVSVGKN
ncbi:hypothetical protein LCGC14_0205190 [marine sediment metagenome]|uniref:Glycosyl-hydrolase family 116 catalytic region domain-containing protein n=1 Tax=marine sediment metagenome TaxID=412755 RepID=A0A0F9X1X8_9ZZZZ